MDKQDMKQNGIDWLVEEIGRLRVIVEQQRAEIQADNAHMRELHTSLDATHIALEHTKKSVEQTRHELEWAKYTNAENALLREQLTSVGAKLNTANATIGKLQEDLGNGLNTHGFPQIITQPDTTLSGFVRQLDYMIGWVDRRLYGKHTTGVVDVNMPELINDLRNLAGNTRRLYHKLENQLDNDKQDQQSGTDELQNTLNSVYEAFGYSNANVGVDEAHGDDKNCMIAKNEYGEVVWVMYW